MRGTFDKREYLVMKVNGEQAGKCSHEILTVEEGLEHGQGGIGERLGGAGG